MKKHIYEIVDQHDEDRVFERFSNFRAAQKELREFYYWRPDELCPVKLLKDGAEIDEPWAFNGNPRFQ